MKLQRPSSAWSQRKLQLKGVATPAARLDSQNQPACGLQRVTGSASLQAELHEYCCRAAEVSLSFCLNLDLRVLIGEHSYVCVVQHFGVLIQDFIANL